MVAEVTVVRDVAAGIKRIRDKGTEYLPKHPKERQADYQTRLDQSVLFNATERTIEGLAGMVFRVDPVLSEDVPPAIAEHMENIDNAGSHIDVFSRDLFEDALASGHAGILVDVPKVDMPSGRAPTVAEERAAGVRPFWRYYRKEDIFLTRPAIVNGRTMLTMLVLREQAVEADGEFGEQDVTRYRVLTAADGVVTGQVWTIENDEIGEAAVVKDEPYVVTNQTEIPFPVVYTKKTGLYKSRPPLLDLAETNLAHYRLLSDHLYAMHIANVPVGVLIGVDPEQEVEIGPNAWLKLPDSQMDFKWAAHDGANFDANVAQLREFKADMAAQGLSLLQVETRQAETATATRMNRSEKDSALSVAARSLEDALQMAMVYHGRFMKIDKPGTITVNRDFENQPMTPDEIRQWREGVATGSWSLETMWQVMAERGALPDDFDPELERERIAGTDMVEV